MGGRGLKRPANSQAEGTNHLKKNKREQLFLPSYTKAYPCVQASKVAKTHARCTVCEFDFSVKHGGFDDVSKHVKSGRHIAKGQALASSSQLTNFFQKADSCKSDFAVIRAETLFAHFLVEHNVPLSAADHAGDLFRRMFPKDETAKQYSSGRTKTTAIIKACAFDNKTDLAEAMKTGPFVIGTDGSQEGGDKLFPIVVRVLGRDNTIRTELLSTPSCEESATGEHIFRLLDDELKELVIDWDKCLALVSDNAYVMTGHRKGVISYIRGKTIDKEGRIAISPRAKWR